MSDKELQELQDPESWDDESQVLPSAKPRRAVVSVPFPREDFERVVEHAQNEGMKTSEFIRQAVLAHLSEGSSHTRAVVLSVSGDVRTYVPFTRHLGPRPRAEIKHQEQDIFTTAS